MSGFRPWSWLVLSTALSIAGCQFPQEQADVAGDSARVTDAEGAAQVDTPPATRLAFMGRLWPNILVYDEGGTLGNAGVTAAAPRRLAKVHLDVQVSSAQLADFKAAMRKPDLAAARTILSDAAKADPDVDQKAFDLIAVMPLGQPGPSQKKGWPTYELIEDYSGQWGAGNAQRLVRMEAEFHFPNPQDWNDFKDAVAQGTNAGIEKGLLAAAGLDADDDDPRVAFIKAVKVS